MRGGGDGKDRGLVPLLPMIPLATPPQIPTSLGLFRGLQSQASALPQRWIFRGLRPRRLKAILEPDLHLSRGAQESSVLPLPFYGHVSCSDSFYVLRVRPASASRLVLHPPGYVPFLLVFLYRRRTCCPCLLKRLLQPAVQLLRAVPPLGV